MSTPSFELQDLEHLQKALREAEWRNQMLSELASDYTFVVEVQGPGRFHLVWASANLKRETGRTEAEVATSDQWTSIIHPEDMPRFWQFAQTLLATRELGTLDCRSCTKDGRERWISISAKAVQRIKGEKIHIFGAVKDVSEARRSEEMLRNMQKLESIGILAGGIAHDFNNLLGGIFGCIDLASETSQDPEVLTYLAKAMATLDRAKGLTQQLLTFARGGSPIRKVGHLFPFVEETIRFALSGANVACTFEVAEGLWPGNYDRNQIAQVLENLAINALHAMPHGGTLEVRARNVRLLERERGELPAGAYVRLSLTDTGTGIPPEILSHIFDPFFTTKPKGHGLGLATSHSILRRHNGCIEVESTPGVGSTFHLHLPAQPHATPQAEPQAPESAHRGGRILVMDDEEILRSLTVQMLEALGFEACSAADGASALECIQQHQALGIPFDVVILDLTIPGGPGGLDTAMAIRALPCSAALVVSSGYAEDPVMAQPRVHGFAASLPKPFRIADLGRVLEEALHADTLHLSNKG